MSTVHLHLLLNHFPVIGTIIATALLGYAIVRRNSDLTKAALGLFVVLAGVAIVVYFTGEPAEETIENLPGFSEAITERHEEAAELATVLLSLFGALALGALAFFRRRLLPRRVALLALLIGVSVTAVMGYAAWLGGQVRHTEVRTVSVAVSPGSHEDSD